MNILKMTDKEINDFADKLWNKKKEEIVEFFLKEIGEISKQDKKEHKSLSDYRCCRELMIGEEYKSINYDNYEIILLCWNNEDYDKKQLMYGNTYSIDTPNELLERELKKRQLWFNLEKHLKENNCLATNEDWKDESKIKYCVSYDFKDMCACVHTWHSHKYNTIIYSTNKKVLTNYIDTLSEEDIKIMFDVE